MICKYVRLYGRTHYNKFQQIAIEIHVFLVNFHYIPYSVFSCLFLGLLENFQLPISNISFIFLCVDLMQKPRLALIDQTILANVTGCTGVKHLFNYKSFFVNVYSHCDHDIYAPFCVVYLGPKNMYIY